MANITTDAETHVIKKADVQTVREIDFVFRFTESAKKLLELLGVTRPIAKEAGTSLKAYKVVGTLENGEVPEGAVIPLSELKTEPVEIGEITLKKWRKATTAEAIMKGGYEQAVSKTTDKMVKLIQNGIKKDFFDFLATGTGVAVGATFQKALAQVWGQLQVIWEDNDIEAVYFMNPLDVADYLGDHNVTLETAFGMTYIQNFLGVGTVFLNSGVPQKHIYATAKENIVAYFVNANSFDGAFALTSDETGLIGIHEFADYERMTADDTVVCGLLLFAENLGGVVVGHIDATPTLATLTVTSVAGTASGDTKLTVSPAITSGNVYKYKAGTSAQTVKYGQNVKSWDDWDGTSDLTIATGKVVTVVEADAQFHADGAGSATVTAKS